MSQPLHNQSVFFRGLSFLAVLCFALGLALPQPVFARLAVQTTASYVPLTPVRLLDTRKAVGVPTSTPIPARSSIDLQVTGVGGVPATGVTAVVLDLVIVNAQSAGFITAWPTGEPMPVASSANATATDRTVANLAVIPVGAGGKVSLYTLMTSHLVADVSGYFVAATSATAGRYVPLDPQRLVDTRIGLGAPKALVTRGSIEVQATGQGGIPATGVSAVAVNVVSVHSSGPLFLTVWPGGEVMPVASSVNTTQAQDVKANLVWVKVGPTGTFNVYSSASSHIVVDVVGYFTDTTAPDSAEGLFVSLPPQRIMDTRKGTPYTRPGSNETRYLSFAGQLGVPTTGVSAVLFNLTLTATASGGYATVYPALQTRPGTSSVNARVAGDTKANLVASRVGSSAEAVAIYHMMATDTVADVAGYFTGVPYALDQPVPTNPNLSASCTVRPFAPIPSVTARTLYFKLSGYIPDPTPTNGVQDASYATGTVKATDAPTPAPVSMIADSQGVLSGETTLYDQIFGYVGKFKVLPDGHIHWQGYLQLDVYQPHAYNIPGYIPEHLSFNLDVVCYA